jgi:FKBP-type peptidyl-prolyl cis-trans isomerase
MLKPRTIRQSLRLACVCVAFIACSSGGASPAAGATAASASAVSATAQAPLDEIQRTQFNPTLGVKLGDMMRRTSGLYVQDQAVGSGAVAAAGRTVVVRYNGWLANGKPIDSGEISVTLGSGRVIRAWEEGLLGMRTGGRRLLVVPPHLGYGSKGAGNDIPPDAVLVFIMQVQSVF